VGDARVTPAKRLFDLVVALVLAVVLLPAIAVLALAILVTDGRPVFYVSERMRTPDQPFNLWKFRTMRVVENDAGVSGGDKVDRITPIGRFLRRTRADELPQLWNVLRGDLSFVGPRPPLRRYVELCPDLYAKVLQSRPGVTGLATLVYHRTEERLLHACRTPEETEAVYVSRCVPRKAALDLIYARRRSLCLDLRLMVATVFRSLTPGRRHRDQSSS
jgi:lipopolysaccharide/colanic/teichoic acid biosynthesis glycosyltransferase